MLMCSLQNNSHNGLFKAIRKLQKITYSSPQFYPWQWHCLGFIKSKTISLPLLDTYRENGTLEMKLDFKKATWLPTEVTHKNEWKLAKAGSACNKAINKDTILVWVELLIHKSGKYDTVRNIVLKEWKKMKAELTLRKSK